MKGIMFNEKYGLESAVLNGTKTRNWRADKQQRYKVGDRVRVKSLEWYETQPKDYHGTILRGGFVQSMSRFCGKEITIRDCMVGYYKVLENDYLWQDWMFEDEAVTEEKNKK